MFFTDKNVRTFLPVTRDEQIYLRKALSFDAGRLGLNSEPASLLRALDTIEREEQRFEELRREKSRST